MVCIIKAMAFPGVVHRCNSWIIHKAECQRIDAFELWCWRRLESPFDSKDINPVNPKGNQPWMSIGRTDTVTEALIFWPPDVKSSLEKTLVLGKIEVKRRRERQEMRWLDSITNTIGMNFSKLWEIVKDRGACCAVAYGIIKNQTELSDWTETEFDGEGQRNNIYIKCISML